jgi:phage tail tape-measure protein
MARKTNKGNEASGTARTSHTYGGEAGAIAGELAGAVLGSAAGPAGAVAGMIVGAAAGALVGTGLEHEIARAQVHDVELDEQIAGAIRASYPANGD